MQAFTFRIQDRRCEVGKGVDRRTFVRGAAGAVGVGAVGAFSPKVSSAIGDEPQEEVATVETVEIPVDLVSIKVSGQVKKVLVCPDAEASPNDEVQWYTVNDGLTIVLVQFKGRSPFKGKEILNPTAKQKVKGNAAGTYSYTVVARDVDRTYALDPDLDIIG